MYHCVTHSFVDWQWLAAAFVVGFVAACGVGFIIVLLNPDSR